MALGYKGRKRLSLLILVLGLPAYVVSAVTIMNLFSRPPSIVVELVIYIVLGILWAFPFKWVFKGIGKPDPDAPDDKV